MYFPLLDVEVTNIDFLTILILLALWYLIKKAKTQHLDVLTAKVTRVQGHLDNAGM